MQSAAQVKGWSDVDILAIAEDEICIIQTKSFAVFENTVKESIDSAVQYFKIAEQFVIKRYPVKNKTIRKIFIADSGLSQTFENAFKSAGIEAVKLKDIFLQYLNLLKTLYPDNYHVGARARKTTSQGL